MKKEEGKHTEKEALVKKKGFLDSITARFPDTEHNF